MKICIVATDGRSLIDFRGRLISTLSEEGHKVVCVSIESAEEMQERIKALGATYVQISGDRVSTGLLSGVKMIKDYEKMFLKERPDACLLYMSKPIAFGGFAAVRTKVPHINVLVNGLENAYYQHGIKDFIVRCVMSFFYHYVGRHADHVFMQNRDDYAYFKNHGIVRPEKMTVVNGSGVDMTYFKREPIPNEPVFLMVARLLWTKGIREYLEAIRIVKEKAPQARFVLVGGLDKSDEGLTEEELNRSIRETELEYHGFTRDVRDYLRNCSVFVLPSYHEGTPRSVLEAMATGRAIVTSDAPGCRETVQAEENGFLVPVGNSAALADRLLCLAEDQALREKMGQKSYELCKEKFEVSKVNRMMIDLITET